MKTSDGAVCPACKGRVSKDPSGKGFIRHLDRLQDGTKCEHGWGEKD